MKQVSSGRQSLIQSIVDCNYQRDHPDKMGFTMLPEVQLRWDSQPNDLAHMSYAKKFLLVCKRFPVHWLSDSVKCLPMIISGLVPILFAGVKSRGIIDTLPSHSGSWVDLERITPSVSRDQVAIHSLLSTVSNSSFFLLTYLSFVAMWSHKLVNPIALRVQLPCFLVQVSISVSNLLLRSYQNVGIPGQFVVQGANLLAGYAVFKYKVGAAVAPHIPGFALLTLKKAFLALLCMASLLVVYQYVVFERVGAWTDQKKMIFVAINPILWEVPVIIMKAIVPTMGFNHTSTDYIMVAWVVACKMATGRFVLSTVSDTTYVTMASACVVCVELGIEFSEMRWRKCREKRDGIKMAIMAIHRKSAYSRATNRKVRVDKLGGAPPGLEKLGKGRLTVWPPFVTICFALSVLTPQSNATMRTRRSSASLSL
jgi:hypothetical protein